MPAIVATKPATIERPLRRAASASRSAASEDDQDAERRRGEDDAGLDRRCSRERPGGRPRRRTRSPISSSHWTFCVTRPRFEMRLRNSAVDSSGSLPGPLLGADVEEEPRQERAAPAASRTAISQTLLSACEDARSRRRTGRRPTGPRRRCRRGGSGRAAAGSTSSAAEQEDHHDDQGLEHEGRPPTDRRGDETADQRSGRGADAAHPADHAERPGTRREVGEQHRGEDVDGRDQQRGADALEDRVAEDQHAEARGRRRSSGRRCRRRRGRR